MLLVPYDKIPPPPPLLILAKEGLVFSHVQAIPSVFSRQRFAFLFGRVFFCCERSRMGDLAFKLGRDSRLIYSSEKMLAWPRAARESASESCGMVSKHRYLKRVFLCTRKMNAYSHLLSLVVFFVCASCVSLLSCDLSFH